MSFVQLAFIEYLFVCNRHNAVVPMVCPFLFFQHYVKLSIFVYITRLHKIGLHFPLCKNVVYIISCVFLRGNIVAIWYQKICTTKYYKFIIVFLCIFVFGRKWHRVAQTFVLANICSVISILKNPSSYKG